MKSFLLVLILSCAALPASRATAYDTFLKIPGIPGESLADKHAGEISVLEFEQAIDRSNGSLSPGTLAVTKMIDRSTAALANAAATGLPLSNLVLAVHKTPDKADFYQITLEAATVTSFDQVLKGGVLMEVITFSFTKIAYSYAMQKPDGSLDTPLVQVVNLGKK